MVKSMVQEKLQSFYTKKPGDKVVTFAEGDGFSLISDYPEGRNDRKVFVRVFLNPEDKQYLSGDVMMVDAKESSFGGHSISENDDPNGKVTNFGFNSEDRFLFKEGRVLNEKFKTGSVSLDDFIDLLIKNHNVDKNRKFRLKYKIISTLVKITLWLVDIDFSGLDVFELKNSMGVQIKNNKDKSTQEPFLRYFNVPKNMFIVLMSTLFIISIVFWDSFKNIEITDIRVVIISATTFMLMDLFSRYINNFLEKSCSGEHWLVKGIYFSHGFVSGGKIKLDFNI